MNHNRQLMKARLVDLQAERETRRKKALSICRQIMPLINPELAEIVEMDIASAATAMDELVMHQAELLSLTASISKLEEALYG
jgi:hypothetical protein